jgi:hypothetical protein
VGGKVIVRCAGRLYPPLMQLIGVCYLVQKGPFSAAASVQTCVLRPRRRRRVFGRQPVEGLSADAAKVVDTAGLGKVTE